MALAPMVCICLQLLPLLTFSLGASRFRNRIPLADALECTKKCQLTLTDHESKNLTLLDDSFR